MSGFIYDRDADGIVTITMNMDGPVNAVNDAYGAEMVATIAKLEREAGLTGVVFASAKKTFVAGGDLNDILAAKAGDEESLFHKIEGIKAPLRRLEKLSVPVVAAINGAALGGGFELCLACNYRIAWSNKQVELGMPEVSLGLLPGAGGVVRLVHLLGFKRALPFLLQGKKLRGEHAREAGFVDETVESLDALIPRAKAWIHDRDADAVAVQPWDRKGATIPGGDIGSPRIAQAVMIATQLLQKETRGLLPAPERILETAVQAVTIDFDAALKLESRNLASLITTPQAKNMITAFFFQLNRVNGGASRPGQFDRSTVNKLGVVGAGMMGQGIAYVAARAGIETVLKDVTVAAAEKGKAYSAALMDKAIARGRADEAEKNRLLSFITATQDPALLQDCDLIIEAVFEDLDLKNQVVSESEHMLRDGGIWASNTSTLPITRLSAAATAPQNFVGMHFFSPVDKMPLVELIRGEQTSDETLAKAFDFARQIKKTPIVVKDGLGFFTSRVIGEQLSEAALMVAEGVDPIRIENLAQAMGMPVGPLTLVDEVSLQFTLRVHETQINSGLLNPDDEPRPRAWAMIKMLVEEHNRAGRHHGDGGYYDYINGEKSIWPGLRTLLYSADIDSSVTDRDVQDRLLFACVIDSIKCIDEGILGSVADGNIGSIMGIGAPAWTGGYLQFVNTFGLERFIARCDELAEQYGERFRAPGIVRKKVEAEELFT